MPEAHHYHPVLFLQETCLKKGAEREMYGTIASLGTYRQDRLVHSKAFVQVR